MPAARASREDRLKSSMTTCSHILNGGASGKVRTCAADMRPDRSYNRNMSRRGIPKTPPVWFLREWMDASGLKGRGAQARMMELTGWTKATMSQLFNGQQDFNSEILRVTAEALNIRTHELLMPPEMAMAQRRLEQHAREIAKEPPIALVASERKTGT